MRRISLCLAAIMWVTSTHAATFTILNMDDAGEGLNDPTPVIPAGGNAASTLGAARLAVLQEAGRVWGLQLASSIPIVVEAQFDPQTCSASSGTLGGAGALTGFSNFAAAPLQNVVYPSALADALAGTNIQNVNDIKATFNSEVNGNANCLNSARFYLGFDHAPPTGTINLLNVALHEFAHGLGFASALDDDGTSQFSSGNLATFDQFIYSETLGRFWPAMTAAERLANATSGTQMVWNGDNVNSGISFLTGGLSTADHLKLYAPATYDSGSSISHWDLTAQWNPTGSAIRSLLMEPYITSNPQGLTDITGCALRDMGWQGTRCVDRGNSNSPPVATAQTIAAIEDTALQITLRGSDPDSTGLLIYSIVTAPTRGVLTAPASLVSNMGVVYIYTPSVNLNGTDTFTFQVSDGTDLSLPATVTINVSTSPTSVQATTPNGGGSGNMDWFTLVALVLLLTYSRHSRFMNYG
jgi:hypothetical protein